MRARRARSWCASTKASTQRGSVRAWSRSAQPIALRMKNSRPYGESGGCACGSSRRGWPRSPRAEQGLVAPLARADLADDGRTAYPQVVGHRPAPDHRRHLLGVGEQQLAHQVGGGLVDEVPPGAGADEVLVEVERGHLAVLAVAPVASQGQGGVALLAEAGARPTAPGPSRARSARRAGRRVQERPQHRLEPRARACRGRASPTSCRPASARRAPDRPRRGALPGRG